MSGIGNGVPHLHLGLLLYNQVEQDSWTFILREGDIRKTMGSYKKGLAPSARVTSVQAPGQLCRRLRASRWRIVSKVSLTRSGARRITETSRLKGDDAAALRRTTSSSRRRTAAGSAPPHGTLHPALPAC